MPAIEFWVIFVVENSIEIQENQNCRVYTGANGTSHTNYCNL